MNMLNLKTLSTLVVALLLCFAMSLPAIAGNVTVYTPHDTNRDGFLEREEFKLLLQVRKIKSENIHLWKFDKVDQDGDGKIPQNEMYAIVKEEIGLLMKKQRSK